MLGHKRIIKTEKKPDLFWAWDLLTHLIRRCRYILFQLSLADKSGFSSLDC